MKNNEKFETLRDAILVRKEITNVLRVLALQTQKKLENLQASLEHAKTEEEYTTIKEKIREERFNAWLIKEECSTVAKRSADLTGNLRLGNTIFPCKDSPAFMNEISERRLNMDRAIGACNVLLDELQFIAEAVYADKNKFTALALKIKNLFDRIKSVRQSDNRFLKV
ncbi:MAG: hypothetical protein IJ859_11605 [Synergistaceae bacterium]|nr:hypothetical protein [Synergistaceae bacterium]